jgi:hypothetical protein
MKNAKAQIDKPDLSSPKSKPKFSPASARGGFISAAALTVVGSIADGLGVNVKDSKVLSTIVAGSQVVDGAVGAGLDLIGTTTKSLIHTFDGDPKTSGLNTFATGMQNSQNNLYKSLHNAETTLSNAGILPTTKTPHQGFTKQPAGHNTAVAMAQDKIASNTLASPSSTYATQPSVIPSQPSVAAAYTQSAAPTTSAPQQPSFGGSGYSAPDSSKYITNNVSRKQEQQREQLDALQDISEKLSSDDSFTKGSDIVDKNADLKG